MEYLFEDIKTGEKVERSYPMGRAPKIGELTLLNGSALRRIPSFVLDVAGTERKVGQYPYVSHRLPSTVDGCELVKTKNGRLKPLIKSQRHEREVMARNDLQRDGEGV